MSDRLVLAGGRESRSPYPYLPNLVLAKGLYKSVVDLPGGHAGYRSHAAQFARELTALLR